MVAGLLFLGVAMLLRHQYAASQSATEGVRIATEQYLLWFIPAMALQFAMVAMGAALRGTGNFKPGMWVQTGTVIINIVLAPFLIFGWGPFPEMGVSGAAVATLVAIVVGVVWISFYFVDAKAYLRFHFGHWRPQLRVWWEMLKIGLPAGAEFALMGIYMAVVYAITKPFGAAAQGGFTIGLRIVQSAFLPVVALAFAVAPVAGQNFAARKGDRVRAAFKAAAGMAAGAMLIAAIGLFAAATPLMRIFTRDPEVDCRRRRVPARRRDHARGVGRDVRVVEHVPGDGQHHSVARHVGAAPGRQHRARDPAVARGGVPPDVDLVHQRGGGVPAVDREPDPPPARVQVEARVGPASAIGSRRSASGHRPQESAMRKPAER